ncbi:MAG: hypothetical protein J6L88_01510, partial [Clostridia bacterium]|nr:hypothetical protein [Clostridia bacterium]
MLKNKLTSIYRENTAFKPFLLSILVTGISYGLFKGMMDNFLAEVVGMGEMGRGVTEFFRELPGVALIFILALFFMFSAQKLYKIGAVIMLVGMSMHALLPPTKVLATLAICIYSLGEHMQIGMKNTIALEYAQDGKGGQALGAHTSATQIGTLVGYIVIIVAFSLITKDQPYTLFFAVAALLAGVSVICSMQVKGDSKTDEHRRRFYLNKKYKK